MRRIGQKCARSPTTENFRAPLNANLARMDAGRLWESDERLEEKIRKKRNGRKKLTLPRSRRVGFRVGMTRKGGVKNYAKRNKKRSRGAVVPGQALQSRRPGVSTSKRQR